MEPSFLFLRKFKLFLISSDTFFLLSADPVRAVIFSGTSDNRILG
jgi:hypothetical protein